VDLTSIVCFLGYTIDICTFIRFGNLKEENKAMPAEGQFFF